MDKLLVKEDILKEINILDEWFWKHDLQGYDVYDLFDTKLFHFLINTNIKFIRKINRKLIKIWITLYPSSVIRLFNIKRNINPKAMGLLLKGYCNLFNITTDKEYRIKAIKISEWLLSNVSSGINGRGWGYPFDWSGTIFIPKFTSSSVVTAIVGDGFYELYKITSDEKYLNVCKEICRFFLEDLNIDQIDDDKICFSYTPIDRNHVHNSNLFVCEFLIRIGIETNNVRFVKFGKRGVNYTLNEQNEDGSILYWGKKDRKHLKLTLSKIDHYHTGFELRKLWAIGNLLSDQKIIDAFTKYFHFYRNKLIGNKGIYYRPERYNPLNIHVFAEFIICNSIIMNGVNTEKEWFMNIFTNHYYELIDSDGLFKYEIRRYGVLQHKSGFKYFRWGQAWMFLALTEFLITKSKIK